MLDAINPILEKLNGNSQSHIDLSRIGAITKTKKVNNTDVVVETTLEKNKIHALIDQVLEPVLKIIMNNKLV